VAPAGASRTAGGSDGDRLFAEVSIGRAKNSRPFDRRYINRVGAGEAGHRRACDCLKE
jgi:hypothetical protein